jgi:hypothetical protein
MTQEQRKKRVAEGRAAFHAFCNIARLPPIEQEQDYSVTDCIVNLLHFADTRGFDADQILLSAGNHYSAEAHRAESCAKCGAVITLEDLEGEGCWEDRGTGEEASTTFYYCSEHCLETH